MIPIIYGILAFAASLVLTFFVRRFSFSRCIVDVPGEGRKKHRGSIPLLGGTAIFLSFWIIFGAAYFFSEPSFWKTISARQIIGVFIAGAGLMIFGYLDDKYSLRPRVQVWGPLLAVAVALLFDVGARFITNPFGGILRLDTYGFGAAWMGIWSIFPANVVAFFWLFGTMYTTKVLDGLDGLVSGIAAIGGFLIFLFATITKYVQPDVALLAMIFAGSAAGFLVWNFYPA
mgnify:FL=1